MNYLLNSLIKGGIWKLLKSVPWYGIVLIIILAIAGKSFAYQYEFKGVYTAEEVFINYCENCYLSLPAEFLQTQLVLSVATDKESQFVTALKRASKANDWNLYKNGKSWAAEPLQNEGKLVYISCLDNEPKNVEKYLYHYARKSDSLKCAERDKIDSINRNIPKRKIDFKTYELQYYSYSKEFSDNLGFEWKEVLASGNFKSVPTFYDSWKFHAQETNDTSFTFRQMIFSVDSTISIDWGTEEQTLEQTYNDGGIITTNYEWRKYGIIINVSRFNGQIKISYTFRDKQQSTSILQGEAVGFEQDTLFLSGNYSLKRENSVGVPFFSSLPLVGYLFSTKKDFVDWRKFDIILIPKTEK